MRFVVDTYCAVNLPRRRRQRWSLVGLAMLVMLVTVGSTALELHAAAADALSVGSLKVWANNGEDKVAQQDIRSQASGRLLNRIWDGKQVLLFGARNEVVSFCLVLDSPQTESPGVSVEMSALEGGSIGRIANGIQPDTNSLFDFRQKYIELFFVRYLQIQGVSTLAYEHYDERHVPHRMRRPFSGAGKGRGYWKDRPDHGMSYPDIAVPLELHPTFDVRAGTSQSIWIDIYIPKATQSGRYNGSVVVRLAKSNATSAAQELAVPVSLHVRDFELPDEPTAKTMVYVSDENIGRRYLGRPYPDVGTRLHQQMMRIIDRHFQIAHRHKLSLIDGYKPPEVVEAYWTDRLSGKLFTKERGYEGVGEGVGNNVYSIGTYGQWPWRGKGQAEMWRNTDRWYNWISRQSFRDKTDVFLYLIDESDDYPSIEKWSRWVDSNPGVGRNLKTLATVPAPKARSETPSLDIACSTVTAAQTDEWAVAVEHYKSKGPEHFVLYNGWRPASGCFAIEDDGIALRQLAWCQFKMGVRRWFAWESTYYDNFQGGNGQTNVFRKAHVFGRLDRVDDSLGATGWNYNNGDGVLFYPGTDRVFPVDSYGVDGPFVSLRLKHWRRGIQDADYLQLASQLDSQRVDRIVARMVPRVLWELGVTDPGDPTWVLSDISWPVDPDVWENARAELADIIEGGEVK